MKKLGMLFKWLILSGLIFGNLSAQEPAVIKIDTDRKIGAVNPNIYGAFLEPIRQIVYGHLYDPASTLADENGFRKDLIQLTRELKIPVIRWPGGNYVSGYNWKDGIGPKDQRPVRMELAWNAVDNNQMGTDEFARFCKIVGAENFICINAGTGTVDEARHWVEYCNVEKGTYYSDLRRKYGNEKPFNVKYWALGNELDGFWQMGYKNVEDYSKFALEAAKLMEWSDKSIKLIVSGASDYNPDNRWIDWNEYVLQHLIGHIDYISVHRYVERGSDFAEFMAMGRDLDQKIGIVKAQIEKTLVKSGSKRPVYISFDEWSGAGEDLGSSLMVAQHLNAFVRNADVVTMANFTMLTSLIGYSPEGTFKNALFHPYYLFSNNCVGNALSVYLNCEKYTTKRFIDVPYLDVTSVYNDSEKVLVVNVVNRHETKKIPTDIILQTGEYTGNAIVNEVNGTSITAKNTYNEQNVSANKKELNVKGNTIRYEFPAHSFTQLKIQVK